MSSNIIVIWEDVLCLEKKNMYMVRSHTQNFVIYKLVANKQFRIYELYGKSFWFWSTSTYKAKANIIDYIIAEIANKH